MSGKNTMLMVCIQCLSTSDPAKAEKHPLEVCMGKDFTLNTNFPSFIKDIVSYDHNTGAATVYKVLKINKIQ